MSEQMPAGLACPNCDALNITQMLYTHLGSTEVMCPNGHRFPDTGDLMAMNPRKLPVPQRTVVQQGYEQVSLSIPTELKIELLRKFGNDPGKIAQTLASVLRALAQPKCFLVNEEDIESLTKTLGQEAKNSRELVGQVWNLKEEWKLAKQAQPVVEKTNGAEPQTPSGCFLIHLESHLAKINALARARGWTGQQLCEETLKTALDNGWA